MSAPDIENQSYEIENIINQTIQERSALVVTEMSGDADNYEKQGKNKDIYGAGVSNTNQMSSTNLVSSSNLE